MLLIAIHIALCDQLDRKNLFTYNLTFCALGGKKGKPIQYKDIKQAVFMRVGCK